MLQSCAGQKQASVTGKTKVNEEKKQKKPNPPYNNKITTG